ncbi:Uncharacterised protein [Enterobacter hormaechei]|uniref:ead/Ea22-like family protein n=1 Tax=Enterobacter hormaechei TaxID=158836 RepID=UPI0007978871|nr:ead/Ea22-like family protein [Enterobacter hormaechei]ELT6675916.1 ead/Ea22-like family protein [Enterobacter hormaechei]MCU2848018.1 ead/Ea22-like family protein [Enterobacter hormaechei subsp. steigerwaltii]SAG25671.1 Uncharacterised protein [Enterobacter hormaechei]HEM8673185.1 ead/Ea22-like family protein [Enterobacter hormaechei]
MSNIDKRALREVAEKATPGPWLWINTGSYFSFLVPQSNQDPHNCIIDDGSSWGEYGETINPKSPDGVFIAAANPSTVLALLDELEAAEKRIAELERNEIREEGNQFLVVRHPGKLPVVKHCAGELEGFLRQLLEHDPMANIDIVTHRYYGVGGQWVQDADEYLQMMATAAGKGE